jgi:hypothetical protein
LDNNIKTVDIIASGGNIYQRRSMTVWGELLKYNGESHQWDLLDQDSGTIQVIADGDRLYKRSSWGEVSAYTPPTGMSFATILHGFRYVYMFIEI